MRTYHYYFNIVNNAKERYEKAEHDSFESFERKCFEKHIEHMHRIAKKDIKNNWDDLRGVKNAAETIYDVSTVAFQAVKNAAKLYIAKHLMRYLEETSKSIDMRRYPWSVSKGIVSELSVELCEAASIFSESITEDAIEKAVFEAIHDVADEYGYSSPIDLETVIFKMTVSISAFSNHPIGKVECAIHDALFVQEIADAWKNKDTGVEEVTENPTATASTSVDPKYPLASPDAIKEAEEIDKLTAAEDAYHKTVETLFDILPEDPDELKDLIASCEVKLENMGENPND